MIRSLDQIKCSQLKGVGPKIANCLERLGISTLQDLIFHLPFRYEDRTQFKPLNQLNLGDQVQVAGEIIEVSVTEGRRRTLLVKITDGSAYLNLRFFNFNAHQLQRFNQVGQKLHCYGLVRFRKHHFEMVHPEYYLLKNDSQRFIDAYLTPIYPATLGLHQYTLRKLIDQVFQFLEGEVELVEYLPAALLEQLNLPTLNEAIHYVHRPPQDADRDLLGLGLHPCQQRLVFEELLAHQLTLAKIRLRTKTLSAPAIFSSGNLVAEFLKHLPFDLTLAQQNVINQIIKDINQVPMLRLLQGDVGCGKTIVAAVIALYIIEAGFQVALMVPTELLAEQHLHNFTSWCSPLNLTVAWLTGSKKGKVRNLIREQIETGEANIIIGTHALFQKDITFNRLGLIIIDEQHRFGVHQRLSLLHKGILLNQHPHQLIMSATPIPRTLAMTAYADLDCSVIDELPAGRSPIKTIILPSNKREELILRVRDNCLKGAQAYWVCTLIDESETLQCQAAEELLKNLEFQLPELRIGLIHGRMKTKEKEKIMFAFKNKEIDLLVATTVIEVGVDVPNATLIVIENAERLGLAQIHQLRGRVGRGASQSYCVLVYQHPLSELAKERLSVLRDASDGFIIAQKDLELRGPGEMLGTRQTGLIQFKIADLSRDHQQLANVQAASQELLQHYPDEAEKLIQRWVGNKEQFIEV